MDDALELVKTLPPELQQEVKDFIDFLNERYKKRIPKMPSFKWAGTMKSSQEKISSVELQHQISKSRIENQ